MYLSNLELMGFKSFAQKTKLKFTDGISCVIGPNGSGKSNIVDAIRWVLGEQKASTLRTDRMESVIFNGSKDRKPLNVAEVSMTIQNNKNILSSEFTDVVISRRLYRSGESQYFINKSPCRLKDIQNLFMDTGMGANSYSVIELSMIENIISENPSERRHLFEEAAGVTRYKAHRKSALRKLDSTRQDMSRIDDIISEISRNVNSLSRQVGKARRYLKFQDELKKLDIDLARYKYTHLQDRIEPLRKTLEEISLIKEDSSQQITLEEAILEEYKREMLQTEQNINNYTRQLHEQDEKLHQINEQTAIAHTRSQNLQDNIKRNLNDIDEYQNKIESLNLRLKETERALNKASKEYDDIKSRYDLQNKDSQKRIVELREKKTVLDKANSDYREQLNTVQSLREILQQKRYQVQWNNEQLELYNTENESLADAKDNLEAKLTEILKLKKEKENQKLNFQEKQSKSQKNIDDISSKISSADDQGSQYKIKIESLTSQLSFYQNVLSNYQGHLESTRTLMMNKDEFPDIHGPITDLIEIPESYASALEVALGEAVNYLVVDDVLTAEKALKHVEEKKLGRVTLIPLELIKKLKIGLQSMGTNNSLIDQINCKPEYKAVLTLLLGDVIIVDNLQEAMNSAANNPEYRYVTKSGEILNRFQGIGGGQTLDPKTSLIGRKEHINKIKKSIRDLENKLSGNIKEVERLLKEKEIFATDIESFRQEVTLRESSIRELEKQEMEAQVQKQNNTDSLDKRLAEKKEATSQILVLENEIKVDEKKLSDHEQKLKSIENNISDLTLAYESEEIQVQENAEITQKMNVQRINAQNALSNLDSENKRLKADIEEMEQLCNKRNSEIREMQSEIDQIEKDSEDREKIQSLIFEDHSKIEIKKVEIEQGYHEVKDKIINLENQIRKFRKQHDSSLERTRQLELEIQESEMKSDSIKERIREEYNDDLSVGIPFDGLNVEESEQQIESLKYKIRQMGQVNPLAVSEYEKESERLEFYTKQYDDLKKAEKSLLETINKINSTARNQFMDTFSSIKTNFEKVFSSFFVKGEGTLRIDEESDPLEANIEILVRPKGNRMQTISLLSGGEKTLTAISLLFSIYLVKPSPFCILDEIDAPLDDVNIGRFTQALNDFSKDTQFIVVTHNKRTMESADTLYGVTMEEEGLSKLVSVIFN